MSDISEKKSTNRIPQYAVTIAANLGTLVCGMAVGWPSPVAPKLLNEKHPALNKPVSGEAFSWVASLICLAAAFGPIFGGRWAFKMGRRMTLLFAYIPFLFAWLMISTTENVVQCIIGRFIMGLGVGIFFTVVPIYVGEISQDAIRGSLGAFLQLFLTIGVMLSFCIGPYVSFPVFGYICAAFPLFFLTIVPFCPESPFYLVSINQHRAALNCLKKLRCTKDDEAVQEELDVIIESVESAQKNQGKWIDIVKVKPFRKAQLISIGLVASQQLSGINVVLMNSESIFKAAGSSLAPEISTMIIGGVQILSSCLTPIVVERLGRRILLLISAAGMGVSLLGLGTFFFLKERTNVDVSSIGVLPILTLVCYIFFFCIGFGPLPWAIMGELFHGSVKAYCSTITASTCWFIAFIMTKFFVNLLAYIGFAGAVWLFAAFCIVAFIFVIFCLPETKGKTLQEIQVALGGS